MLLDKKTVKYLYCHALHSIEKNVYLCESDLLFVYQGISKITNNGERAYKTKQYHIDWQGLTNMHKEHDSFLKIHVNDEKDIL